ncbi:hypothetical protein CFP65_6682 [Kitasatospora sp. MMS16-BH015]|uniref:NAD-dependent epimerase/dehydratase family protein n=1 Tax=Kitasatospora sp. MMS16-BH015 TaxID=2018025 RepID=UPI000CA2BAEE|nr:NAD-dependent epimerase/dehydratase family protein [Kitasatospora sp. MMS16-BH015]AUG81327.1 hypothetical protein CFP65_6682 [Kitasatospora sp. MMS16-BH015]
MLVLVTGAYGFVGRAVVRRLAADGHRVRALTHRPSGEPLPELPVEGVHHADLGDHADRGDPVALAPAVAGVDAVCHLAALTNGRASGELAEEYRRVNLGGTEALLDAVTAGPGPPPRFVLASTAAVYGAPERQPITELTEPAPGNPYGASKLAAEQALHARAGRLNGELTGVVLRCFNVGGTEDRDETRIIPRALAVAAGRHPQLDLNGDGGLVRDFVHVADLARAYALALTAPLAPGVHTFNVGATPASMAEIIATVERVTGRPVPVRRHPPKNEAPYLAADTTRIAGALGWRPERSGLTELVADAWRSDRDRGFS